MWMHNDDDDDNERMNEMKWMEKVHVKIITLNSSSRFSNQFNHSSWD